MATIESENTLNSLKRELRAWETHIEKLGLDDRMSFIEWLSQALDTKEFALIIDAEIERPTLWRAYLRKRYGPCEGPLRF